MEVIIPTRQPLPQRAPKKRVRQTQQALVQRQQVVTIQPAPGNGKNRKRNRKRRAARRALMFGADMSAPLVQYSPSTPLQNPLVPQAPGVSTSRSRMVQQRMAMMAGQKLTPEGMRFLKCAFSAADFDGSGVYGVPDEFAGRSSAIKHRAVFSQTFAAGVDYYFIVAPTPGAAYYGTGVAAGTPILQNTSFNMVPYSDYNSLFEPTGAPVNASQSVQKFRYVSQHFEICPTTNANTWTGSIQVFKLPCQAANTEDTLVGGGANKLTISGLAGCNAVDADMYSGPFNLGCYAGAFNKGSRAWEFSDIWGYQSALPAAITGQDFGQLNAAGGLVTGFDNSFETIVVKVSGVTGTTGNSALIRTWACVEYQFTPGTVMYEMQNLKSMEDQLALKLYRKIITELPTAVSFLDNANFWMRVLGIIRQITGSLSVIPGPYGAIAGGVNAVATGIEQLVI